MKYKCPKSLTIIWQLLPLITIIKEWRCLKFGLWDCRSLLLQSDCRDERAEKLYKHYSEGSINPPKMVQAFTNSCTNLIHQQEIRMTTWLWVQRWPCQNLWDFNSKECHKLCSPWAAKDCKNARCATQIGHHTRTCMWEIKMELPQASINTVCHCKGYNEQGKLIFWPFLLADKIEITRLLKAYSKSG